MASRDMASACDAEVLGLPVAKVINEDQLESAYNCPVSVREHGRGGQDEDPYAKYD